MWFIIAVVLGAAIILSGASYMVYNWIKTEYAHFKGWLTEQINAAIAASKAPSDNTPVK